MHGTVGFVSIILSGHLSMVLICSIVTILSLLLIFGSVCLLWAFYLKHRVKILSLVSSLVYVLHWPLSQSL